MEADKPKYSIDTSAILDGWIRYYPPDVFPVAWRMVEELIDSGVLIAAEEVLVDLQKKDDDVYKWARRHQSMFVPVDEAIQIAVKEILASHRRLVDTRRNRSGADPFVIALAKINGCAVITGEKPSNSTDRPNIPDVCNAMGIRWLNMLELFREQGWSFK